MRKKFSHQRSYQTKKNKVDFLQLKANLLALLSQNNLLFDYIFVALSSNLYQEKI